MLEPDPDPDPDHGAATPRHARLAAYAKASTHLALLSDHKLSKLMHDATSLGSGIGGESAVLEADGVEVFAKTVPITELELRPENIMSTANLFGLPEFYQYGVGSAGFGAWRELGGRVGRPCAP